AALRARPKCVRRANCRCVFRIALKVQSLHFARPRAHEREPLVIRVNQLRRIRQGIDEDTEPTEWIRACELLARSEWHRRPAHAVIAVAAGDEIAAKLVYAFVMLEADARLRRVEVVEGDVAHVEYDRSAGSEPRMNQ